MKTDDMLEMLIWNADVETWFDSSNYELDRPLPKGKVKKVIAKENMNCIRKDELGGEIMKKNSWIKSKNSEETKAMTQEKYVIKRKLKFEKKENWKKPFRSNSTW